MSKKQAHIITHSHWDREWYMPFERHHMLLIELIDTLLDTLDRDPEYHSFHLDGQTIIIEDYLQVRPEQRERLERYIREGKIVIGPWYVLQDEFLTSSEANVRNLLIGHQDASRYGVICKLGYFPDSFGNMGQAPQLLKQADIDTAVFGRGVKPTGFNNAVVDSDSYASPYSEMFWQGPDGSTVIGILFANWYHNGMEIPTDPEEAKVYWEKKLADAEKFASTPELLFMNGCDHQPVQTDLSQALKTARKLFPDVDFVHSSFDQYIAALKTKLPHQDLVTIKGELRSQHTDGWGTLVNTASSRIYLKQLNAACQTLLEKGAEPLALFARIASGKSYPHDLLTYAWKTLMQNHPHDSICGCSVDEVHREMVARFEKSRHATEHIIDESMLTIASSIDTSVFAGYGEQAFPFVVFNTTGWERSRTVTIELETDKLYFHERPSIADLTEELEAIPFVLDDYVLMDAEGHQVNMKAENLGVHFGYDLPKDKFRQPYMARKVRITFEARQLPALGYKTYALVKMEAENEKQTTNTQTSPLTVHERGMENNYITVTIHENGSLEMTDKKTGRTYSNLLIYENCGDVGNEYVFKMPDNDQLLTTQQVQAHIRLVESEPYRASFEIVHEWEIPARANDLFEEEKRKLVPFKERKAQRVQETVPLRIVTTISLDREGKGVQVHTHFKNEARDHRLRVRFESGIHAAKHTADSIFEAVQRDTVPAPEWTNPSNAQHMQQFVSVANEQHGLTIAGKGLHEYEVLQDDCGTIAVTLLRAVSELGDWGVFETPEAQCLGEQHAEFAIYPHQGDVVASQAFASAYQFQAPVFHTQTDIHTGSLPPEHRFLSWSGDTLALSAAKMSKEHNDVIIRWYNLDNAQSNTLNFTPNFTVKAVYKSDILERRHEEIPAEMDATIGTSESGLQISQSVGKAEIITYAFKLD